MAGWISSASSVLSVTVAVLASLTVLSVVTCASGSTLAVSGSCFVSNLFSPGMSLYVPAVAP